MFRDSVFFSLMILIYEKLCESLSYVTKLYKYFYWFLFLIFYLHSDQPTFLITTVINYRERGIDYLVSIIPSSFLGHNSYKPGICFSFKIRYINTIRVYILYIVYIFVVDTFCCVHYCEQYDLHTVTRLLGAKLTKLIHIRVIYT